MVFGLAWPKNWLGSFDEAPDSAQEELPLGGSLALASMARLLKAAMASSDADAPLWHVYATFNLFDTYFG